MCSHRQEGVGEDWTTGDGLVGHHRWQRERSSRVLGVGFCLGNSLDYKDCCFFYLLRTVSAQPSGESH